LRRNIKNGSFAAGRSSSQKNAAHLRVQECAASLARLSLERRPSFPALCPPSPPRPLVRAGGRGDVRLESYFFFGEQVHLAAGWLQPEQTLFLIGAPQILHGLHPHT